ncbi:MAG: hypothetical protein ACJ79S_01450 [Gemmatimonadaceae bacterium]
MPCCAAETSCVGITPRNSPMPPRTNSVGPPPKPTLPPRSPPLSRWAGRRVQEKPARGLRWVSLGKWSVRRPNASSTAGL